MSNCSSSTYPEFLQPESFLRTSLHILTTLGLPIHLFGAYCILFKTPKQMLDMKWTMLNLQLWSFGFDISVGFLFLPFVTFPAMAGVGLGLLSDLGVPIKFQTFIGVSSLSAVIVSVTCLFETRYFYLYARNSTWKYIRKYWLVANYILAFTYLTPSLLTVPDQKEAKLFEILLIPCLPEAILEDRYFVATIWRHWVVLNVAILVIPVFIECFTFVFLIYRNMRRMSVSARLSKKTLDLQRNFLTALILQVALPVLIICAPLYYFWYSMFTYYYNQGFNNVATIIISLHGTMSSLAMILIHKPYREVLKLKGSKSGKKTAGKISVSIVTMH